jgi:hypothetical protein
MMPHWIPRSIPPGSCIRVVYSIEGLDLFAIGILIDNARDHITMQQYSDQYGPVEPFRLIIPRHAIIRLSASERRSRLPHCHAE